MTIQLLFVTAAFMLFIGYIIGRELAHRACRKNMISAFEAGVAEGQAEPYMLMPHQARVRAEEWINLEVLDGRFPESYYAG